MLIEQIIEFALRGQGPPGRICSPIPGYFYEKTKISVENLRVDYYLEVKYCSRQCTLLHPAKAKSLSKFNHKMS